MKRIIIIVPVALLLWISCEDTMVEPTPNVVRGIVIDSLTRIPLDSAWVDSRDTLAPHMAYADSLGNYSTVVGYAGNYIVYCGKDGYVTQNKKVTFTGKGITAVINFELVPKGAR